MTIGEHEETFHGLPIIAAEEVESFADCAPRIALDYDSELSLEEKLSALLERPGAKGMRALVIGPWWPEIASDVNGEEVVGLLVAARDRLPALEALFFGDVVAYESEISWIEHGDASPLFSAFPALRTLRIRGANGLSLGQPKHRTLENLIIESGGLDVSVVRQIDAAELPALRHLELWLGDEGYGANVAVDDLAPILSGEKFPKLTRLGLRDARNADDVAAAVARSKLLERLEVLDLSLGTLGDAGARALLASPAIAKLKKLDVHHHYISAEVVAKLVDLGRHGVEVDAGDQRESEDDGHRYVAVSE
jgi:hypothetical protein